MPIDASISTSFQSNADANNAVRRALTGTQVPGVPEAPFQKLGTSVYVASNVPEADVVAALGRLGPILVNHGATLDHVAITLVRHTRP